MKKMIVSVAAICFTLLTFAQSNSKILENKERTVYWFQMGIKYSEPNDNADIIYTISKTDELKSGTIKEFETDVYRALKNYHICIGYYNTKQEAEEAKSIYDKLSDMDLEALNAYNYPEQEFKSYSGKVFWFILHPFEGKKQWHYKRKPGALASGTIDDFKLFLNENLLNKVFTVGPFIYGATGEDSKRIFRLDNDGYNKMIKYPFNFEGTWVSKPGSELMTIDIKKGFKTKITCSFTTEGLEIERTEENYNLIHPSIISFSFDIFEVLHNYYYVILFLSEDKKSIKVKMTDKDKVEKVYTLFKQ